MIVEELTALLGYKVSGTDQLRKWNSGIENAKGAVSRLGVALNRTFAASLSRGVVAASGASAVLAGNVEKTRRSSLGTAVAIGSTIRSVAILTAGFAAAAVSVGTMVAGLVAARGAAARLRRDLQLGDAQNRTTPSSIEKVSKGLQVYGAKEDQVREAVADIFKKSDEAIKDPTSESAKWFKENRIATMDKRGNQRDPSAMYLEIERLYLKRRQERDKLRAASDADKPNQKKLDAANAAEIKLRKERENYPGLSGLYKYLDSIKGGAPELDATRDKANRINPAATGQEEEAARKAAERWANTTQRLEAVFDGAQRAAARFGDTLSEKVSSPFDNFLDGVIERMKNANIIPRTESERVDLKENLIARERSRAADPDVEAARRKLATRNDGGALGWFFGQDDVEKAISRAKQAVERYDTAKTARDQAMENQSPSLKADQEALVAALKEVTAAMRALETSPNATVGRYEADPSNPRTTHGLPRPYAQSGTSTRPGGTSNIDPGVMERARRETVEKRADKEGFIARARTGLANLDVSGAEAGIGRIQSAIAEVQSQTVAAGAALEASLNVTGTPKVNTSEIAAAQAMAEKLVATLGGVSSAAGAIRSQLQSTRPLSVSLVKGNLPIGRSGAEP